MHLNQISRPRPHGARPPGRRPGRWPWLGAVTLAACLAAAYPAAAAVGGTAVVAGPPRPLNCGPRDYFIQCYTPRAYEVAYGVAPLLRRGIDGRGETVALPELAETPSHSGLSYTDIRPKITGGASGLVHLESFARLLVQLRRRHCADSAPSFSIASGHVTRVQNAIFCLPWPRPRPVCLGRGRPRCPPRTRSIDITHYRSSGNKNSVTETRSQAMPAFSSV
jgi:hypothetical protein